LGIPLFQTPASSLNVEDMREEKVTGFRIDKRLGKFAVVLLLIVIATFSMGLPTSQVSADGVPAYAPDRSKSPTDIPSAPSTADRVVVRLITEEKLGQLADGVTYDFWTFNGTVPGPFIRLRLNQTVEMHIINPPNSTMTHSIDSHAILGTGGGSVYSQTPPGQESVFQFKALRVGLFMYHCASPDIPSHIANGMYGLILVEPPGGLPTVDREFYIAQGEFYTQGAFGQKGFQAYSFQKADAETPDYVVFNGRVGSLTGSRSLKVNVGDKVRIFFLNAGPNLDSSLHIIGGMLDAVYIEGSILSPPLLNVQTTLVPAGGSVMVEFTAEVPSRLTIVDHSLFRIHHGAIGYINVTGTPNPALFSSIKNATISANTTMNMNTTETISNSSASTESAASNATTVLIVNFAYSPADLTVPVGTTVTWVNQDSVGHTVTEGDPNSPKQAGMRVFDSSGEAVNGKVGLIGPGESWSYTFTTPGTYEYYCIVHPYMIGRITVTSASGSNASSGLGYSELTNFTVTVSGSDIVAFSAFGMVILVALMLIFARGPKKQGNSSAPSNDIRKD
jgi:nitrite reductase (NO-forming)